MGSFPPPRGARLRLILLAGGAALGLLAAAVELVGPAGTRTGGLPDQVVARVGGRDIPLERYRAVLGDLAADRRTPLTPAERDHALQRLIDEELLLIQGMRMGLAESLPDVRKVLVGAVIAQTVSEAEAIKPTEGQLRELFDSNPAFFTATARYRVLWLRSAREATHEISSLREAAARISAGADAESVAAKIGFDRVRELPYALLPLPKLQDYLGAMLAATVSAAAPGAVAGPVMHDGRAHILYLAEYLPPELPHFDRIRPLVEAEFTRRQGDAALRRQLERLRRDNAIIVDDAKLAQP